MTSQKPIAVGTNDSAQSQAAVLWAARRAHRFGLPLVIVHVVDDRWVAEPYPWFGTLQQVGEELLKTAAGRLEGTVPVTPDTELLTGSVGGALAKYSKRTSMMVIGSGSGHLGGALADRALQVATAAKVPVAVVGTHDLEGRSGVVVGVDGSAEATQAVAFAAAEADRDGDELTVVYAVNVPDPIVDAGLVPGALADLMVDEERIVLSETVAGLKEDYPDLTVHQRLESDKGAVDALVDAAAGARLLVVGSRGRGAFKRLLLGSTAHGVLKHLPCPTIITRTDAAHGTI
ncbi:nucleotide-binding universal stress UspA family protein [Arthrobacter ulcerisalmonis]|uniref:universal stress protein n=1 Tax=Arthrobacter sp. B1I2 TaxID=3042263 RepID=UPI002788694C|nr:MULTISPECIES: universal stress protein [Arthrobacter]MDQ0664117.1 nucleotide-binding universal stress UspA family protein [Arthrobacter ulcerisalmonis]MDQ0732015.1 nucleotide-binding universal stress UspA family protein [Arthrobacter sp. B1I2]